MGGATARALGWARTENRVGVSVGEEEGVDAANAVPRQVPKAGLAHGLAGVDHDGAHPAVRPAKSYQDGHVASTIAGGGIKGALAYCAFWKGGVGANNAPQLRKACRNA